jgi:hypothetical protein
MASEFEATCGAVWVASSVPHSFQSASIYYRSDKREMRPVNVFASGLLVVKML